MSQFEKNKPEEPVAEQSSPTAFLAFGGALGLAVAWVLIVGYALVDKLLFCDEVAWLDGFLIAEAVAWLAIGVSAVTRASRGASPWAFLLGWFTALIVIALIAIDAAPATHCGLFDGPGVP